MLIGLGGLHDADEIRAGEFPVTECALFTCFVSECLHLYVTPPSCKVYEQSVF